MKNKRDKDQIIVAIWMVTYNHEDYIAQAVESIMMQKSNFKYKLFIGEDCSTDSTRKICIELKEKYSDKIELILQESNIGANKNAEKIFNSCAESNAKYIALLEGDDYWIDELKLQKQVDFLEANTDYVIHSSLIKKYDGNTFVDYDMPEKTFVANDFYLKNSLFTCTVMFRNHLINDFTFLAKVFMGDWFLYVNLLHLSKKKAFRSTETYAVYRNHPGGITKSINKEGLIEKHHQQLEVIEEYIGGFGDVKNEDKNISYYYISKLKKLYKDRLFMKAFLFFLANMKPKTLRLHFNRLKNRINIYL